LKDLEQALFEKWISRKGAREEAQSGKAIFFLLCASSLAPLRETKIS